MTNSQVHGQAVRVVHVWDVPTRVFHWLLLALVVTAWFTGEGEGGTGAIHRYAGEAVAGLIVFRVIWGFWGGEHARFTDFAAGPTRIGAYIRSLFSNVPPRPLGHNPLGGVAVFLLLANVTIIVATGLFSGGEDNAGPFAGMWGLELSEIHEGAFRVLQGLTILHVAGVVVESFASKDALVPAMFTGSKTRRADEPGNDAKRASVPALILALVLGAATTAALVMAPPSTSSAIGHGDYDDD